MSNAEYVPTSAVPVFYWKSDFNDDYDVVLLVSNDKIVKSQITNFICNSSGYRKDEHAVMFGSIDSGMINMNNLRFEPQFFIVYPKENTDVEGFAEELKGKLASRDITAQTKDIHEIFFDKFVNQ
ncbi:hypothetical protein GGI19_003723 [Coemansia pectinata]|uniref:Uncharacterized protein n=1 Tax=Coemansia pectinata TaxID=1052879 RepID=A0A9W8LAN7_9FUNG|nr:hypothetical protein GGI19_003723 [Coemansia pectinata]